MSNSAALAPIVAHLHATPSRSWSLIVSLFGDMVVPRGGQLWLGTLLTIFEALKIGGNVVRTATSRLAADGWLARARIGRNSYYRLAEKGLTIFTEAAERVYRAPRPVWDGAFHLAVLGGGDREPARIMLEQAGYATLSPGVLVAFSPPALPPDVGFVPLRAETDPDAARRLAALAWPTERLEAGYRGFLAAFRPLAAELDSGATLCDIEALLARLLLIHAYRRLVLRDPLLPAALLADEWPGGAARALCAALYARLLDGSERWLDRNATNAEGRLPPPSLPLAMRFRD